VLTTEFLLVFPEDAPGPSIQQSIKLQQSADTRPAPLLSIPMAAIRGFCCLGCDSELP
jgi:hypothetical protein